MVIVRICRIFYDYQRLELSVVLFILKDKFGVYAVT